MTSIAKDSRTGEMNFGNDWREDSCSVREKLNQLKYTLTNENIQPDVVIVVVCGSNKTKIKAHSFMLAVGSQVLERLLEQGKMNNEGMKEIKLLDVSPEAMKFVLKYIYTDVTEWGSKDTIDILYVSLKLNLLGLAALCVTKLKDEISAANVLRIFEESVKFNVEELVQNSQEFILRNANKVFQNEQFRRITNESLCKLLAFDELEMDEISIFNCIVGWGKEECARSALEESSENLRFVLKKVVPLIRFTHMSLHEFTSIVVPTKILENKEIIDVYKYLRMKTSNTGKHAEPPLWISSTSERKVANADKETSDTDSYASGISQPANRGNVQEQMHPKNTNKDKLLQYLKNISGKKTLSGLYVTHMGDTDRHKGVQTIQRTTGFLPGILTLMLPSSSAGVDVWQSFAEEIISNWNNGYLVGIVWGPDQHPLSQLEICEARFDYNWKDLIKDDGHLNREWKKQLDSIAPYFKQLQDAGVVVISNFFPCTNYTGVIWGGRPGMNGSKKLYQLTHDYLTQKYQLHSLLWTFCLYGQVDMTKLEDLWPGNEYVDIVTVFMDSKKQLGMNVYQKLLEAVGDKPISMESVYSVPSLEVLTLQPGWAWFTAYDGYLEKASINSNDNIKTTFQSVSIINKENNDFFKPS